MKIKENKSALGTFKTPAPASVAPGLAAVLLLDRKHRQEWRKW